MLDACLRSTHARAHTCARKHTHTLHTHSHTHTHTGANTQLACIIAGLIMFVVLAALTPLFYHLPRAVLGAIVVFAVSGLVDTAEPLRLWKTVLRERGGGGGGSVRGERERERKLDTRTRNAPYTHAHTKWHALALPLSYVLSTPHPHPHPTPHPFSLLGGIRGPDVAICHLSYNVPRGGRDWRGCRRGSVPLCLDCSRGGPQLRGAWECARHQRLP